MEENHHVWMSVVSALPVHGINMHTSCNSYSTWFIMGLGCVKLINMQSETRASVRFKDGEEDWRGLGWIKNKSTSIPSNPSQYPCGEV